MTPGTLRAAAVLLLLAGGCATTRVVTEPGARVWFDGRRVLPGQKIRATGPPHEARVLVITRDGRRTEATVSREFDTRTLLLGFYTWGVCWAVCWRYPSEVTVLLPPPGAPGASSAWDVAPYDDPWALPPPGWREPVPASPPPAPAPDAGGDDGWETPPRPER